MLRTRTAYCDRWRRALEWERCPASTNFISLRTITLRHREGANGRRHRQRSTSCPQKPHAARAHRADVILPCRFERRVSSQWPSGLGRRRHLRWGELPRMCREPVVSAPHERRDEADRDKRSKQDVQTPLAQTHGPAKVQIQVAWRSLRTNWDDRSPVSELWFQM
jgi:hypothetical protein